MIVRELMMQAPRTRVTVHQVDVFTRVSGQGNRAGVVLDAGDLTEAQMQSVARRAGHSETAFVFPLEEGTTVPVRFFTPTTEVPICGHATLAAHFVRAAAMRQLGRGTVTQRSPGARWRVHWSTTGDRTTVSMVQGPVEFGPVWGEDRIWALLAAVGLRKQDLAEGRPVQEVSTGHPKVVVPISSEAALGAVRPDMTALIELSRSTGIAGYFLYAPGEGNDYLTSCRMFAPALGIPEDPVNGSGHGPLGAYLRRHHPSLAERLAGGFRSRMGHFLNRPGEVFVRMESDLEVEVGGLVTPGPALRLRP